MILPAIADVVGLIIHVEPNGAPSAGDCLLTVLEILTSGETGLDLNG
jgi:hypothetical protein